MFSRVWRTHDGSTRMLVSVFLAVVGSFVATTYALQRSSVEIDSLSDQIASEISPSITELAELRGATLELELALSRYVREDDARRRLASRLDASLTALGEQVDRYLVLRPGPGEQPRIDDVRRSWARLADASRRARELADRGKNVEARNVYSDSVEPAASVLVGAAMRAIEHNATTARANAARISTVRQRTIWLANALTAITAALGLGGALLLHRQARSRRDAALARARALEARADELEQFAGRVAHDIRNPLSAAKLATELLMASSDDEKVSRHATRIERSLERADAITTALLDFARSGAQPDPGARTNPSAVIADMAGAIEREAERARIELDIGAVPAVLVACSPGVYMSLLGNLIRNAIKHMGDVSTRRISVRVVADGDRVRTEVEDTGPGVPAESLPSLFEPYFRGQTGRDGLGLGLATVKKLAEAHHGRAAVTTARGKGSTFWFELPLAGSAWEDADHGYDSHAASVTHH